MSEERGELGAIEGEGHSEGTTDSSQTGDVSFGRYLYEAREDRGVSLDDLAVRTKIPMTTLQALESDDWDHLPGRIFVVGFIRTYAKHLGINEQEAISRYDQFKKSSLAPTRFSVKPTFIPSPAVPPSGTPVASPAPSTTSSSSDASDKILAVAEIVDGKLPLVLAFLALLATAILCLNVGDSNPDPSSPAVETQATASTSVD